MEASTVYLTGGSYTKGAGVTPHRVRPTGRSSSLREEEAPIWRGKGHQVTRELLGTKPWIVLGVKQGLVKLGTYREKKRKKTLSLNSLITHLAY